MCESFIVASKALFGDNLFHLCKQYTQHQQIIYASKGVSLIVCIKGTRFDSMDVIVKACFNARPMQEYHP
jgi:hypothetical protein